MPGFTFLVGCADCTPPMQTFRDLTRRQHALEGHVTSHAAEPFVAATEHPNTDPAADTETFEPGDTVTFYGSTTDQAADHQQAVVVSARRGVDQDSLPVDGYLLQVPVTKDGGGTATYTVFAPAASVLRHGDAQPD